VVILIEDICYVANVGDSRALLSEDCSSIVRQLSKDHRPDDESEKNRVQKAGGSVYITKYHDLNTNKEESGPVRIFPGKLSVSRSFGDVHAKHQKLGGNDRVLIALPEVRSFKIKDSTDFIVLGCDGIFEKMSNTDVIHSVWSMAKENSIGPDIHEHCGRCVDMVLKNCLKIGSNDNLTFILLSFKNFKRNLYNLRFENSEKRFGHLNNIKSKIFENITEESFKLIDECEEETYNYSSTPKSEKDSSLSSINNGVYNNRTGDLSSLPIISKLSKK
jgi:protein phosphatase PTC2/3